MKIGLRFSTKKKMIIFALDYDYFSWKPGLIESGSNYPPTRFESYGQEYYWHYSFLFFTLFLAKVR